jgi:hypothetical protein
MVTDAIEGRSIHPSCTRVSHRMIVRESTSRPHDMSRIRNAPDRFSGNASRPDEPSWPDIVPLAKAIAPRK